MASSEAQKKTYNGHCHCRAVQFTVELAPLDGPEPAQVYNCNCSICVQNGYLIAIGAKPDLVYTQGEDKLTSYSFNKKKVSHNFCSICGSSVTGHSFESPFLVVNARSLDDIDVTALNLKPYDGKAL